MRVTCWCDCHVMTVLDRLRFEGVDVTDPVYAAMACDSCRNNHSECLLSTRLANDPEPPTQDIVLWVDSLPPSADATGDKGEGPE